MQCLSREAVVSSCSVHCRETIFLVQCTSGDTASRQVVLVIPIHYQSSMPAVGLQAYSVYIGGTRVRGHAWGQQATHV